MWTLAASTAEQEPSTTMVVVALVFLALAFVGLGSIFRRVKGAAVKLHVANKARLDAKLAAKSDAAADAGAVAGARVDVGGIHLHGSGGTSTGHHDDRTAARVVHLDQLDRGTRFVLHDGTAVDVDELTGALGATGVESERSSRGGSVDGVGSAGRVLESWPPVRPGAVATPMSEEGPADASLG